jgi:hypothetical protein
MTSINRTKSKVRLSAKLAAGFAISAALVLGTLAAAPAYAGWGDHDNHRGNDRHAWNGAHYRAPPVVYGGYYGGGYGYYPPPVVYGPNIGIGVPGISIGIW